MRAAASMPLGCHSFCASTRLLGRIWAATAACNAQPSGVSTSSLQATDGALQAASLDALLSWRGARAAAHGAATPRGCSMARDAGWDACEDVGHLQHPGEEPQLGRNPLRGAMRARGGWLGSMGGQTRAAGASVSARGGAQAGSRAEGYDGAQDDSCPYERGRPSGWAGSSGPRGASAPGRLWGALKSGLGLGHRAHSSSPARAPQRAPALTGRGGDREACVWWPDAGARMLSCACSFRMHGFLAVIKL